MKEQVHRLIRNSAVTLRKSLDRSHRMLVFFLEPFGGEMQICWPLRNSTEVTAASSTLVQACFKRERSVVVHDSALDQLTKSFGGKEFRSALCVPLADKDKFVMGVIYIDSPEVGAFEKERRLQVERLARKMSGRIPRWSAVQAEPETKDSTNPKFDFRTVGIVLGVSVFFVLSWFFAPSDPVPQPTPGVSGFPAAKRTSPEDVSRSYLALVGLRESQQVSALLAPALREKINDEEIKQQIAAWFSDQERRWEFGKRKVRLIDQSPRSATVSVVPGVKEEVLSSWTIELSLVEEEWKIVSLTRGPITVP